MPDGRMTVRMAVRLGAFQTVVIVPVMLIMPVLVPMAFRSVSVLQYDYVGAGPRTGREDRKQKYCAAEHQRRGLYANTRSELTRDWISQQPATVGQRKLCREIGRPICCR